MNLDLKTITTKLQPAIQFFRKNVVIIFVVALSLIFSFLIMKINGYAQVEPTEDAISEKLTTVQRPKIDQNALEKIQQLQDQNVEVQSLFEQARENPFSE